jgi:hypothetical protein
MSADVYYQGIPRSRCRGYEIIFPMRRVQAQIQPVLIEWFCCGIFGFPFPDRDQEKYEPARCANRAK